VVCPYYSRPSQRGLYEHFKTIASNLPVPQLVYNISGRTAVNIDTKTLGELARQPHIVGVKESSNNIEQVSEVLRSTPDGFLVLSGCDHLNFTTLCLGGHGVISTVANLVPDKVKSMVDAALSGQLSAARELHFELSQLTSGCSLETNPIPVKTALALMGLVKENFRLPMCTMDPLNRNDWIAILQEHGLLNEPSISHHNRATTLELDV